MLTGGVGKQGHTCKKTEGVNDQALNYRNWI
jgi:hypothetical protein